MAFTAKEDRILATMARIRIGEVIEGTLDPVTFIVQIAKATEAQVHTAIETFRVERRAALVAANANLAARDAANDTEIADLDS